MGKPRATEVDRPTDGLEAYGRWDPPQVFCSASKETGGLSIRKPRHLPRQVLDAVSTEGVEFNCRAEGGEGNVEA